MCAQIFHAYFPANGEPLGCTQMLAQIWAHIWADLWGIWAPILGTHVGIHFGTLLGHFGATHLATGATPQAAPLQL